MSNNKKKVLITGGAGFIGSHTAEKFLKNNFKVIVLDNLSGGNLININHLKKSKDFKFIKIDILNFKKLKKLKKIIENCSYILHFAGVGDIVPSIKNPIKYFQNNVQGTINILNLCNSKKIKKFVYAASSSCYGKAKIPTNEKHKINPLYPYAMSKYQGEQICFHWSKVYNLPVNSIRIFNAYGTRSRTTGAYGAVFGIFLKQILSRKPLTVVKDGNQKRDFIFVTDVANAFFKATITKKNNRIWNLGSGRPKSVKNLIKILNQKKITWIPKRPGEPKITHANISKIKKDLNWKPKVSFKTGVSIILKNIDYWKNAPLWDKNKIKKETKLWFKYLK
tara:strand:- start:1282 stop:2289 length:1008 start_codon:yes stop_codon:yes gene_type:complete